MQNIFPLRIDQIYLWLLFLFFIMEATAASTHSIVSPISFSISSFLSRKKLNNSLFLGIYDYRPGCDTDIHLGKLVPNFFSITLKNVTPAVVETALPG